MLGPLDNHLKDFNSLCGFGLARVRPVTTSFLCCTHFLTVLLLTALLVAKLKADPELSHVAARENVGDPLDYKRTGFLLICWACSCKDIYECKYSCEDWLIGAIVAKKQQPQNSHLPTLRKVRSSIGRIACGRSVLCPSGSSGSGGGSGQRKRE